ncbi:MAG TPA: hypothetical protein VGK16_16395 [Candidatus Limnocylindrales bacterium]
MDRHWLAVAITVVLALPLAGCGQVADLPGAAALLGRDGPTGTVGRSLAAVADGDLVAASGYVCPDFRNPSELPIPLSIQFGLSRLPGVTTAQVLSVADIDFSGLRAHETTRDADQASVDLAGAIVLRYDLDAVRALAIEATGGAEPQTVDTVLAILGDGTLTVSTATSVWLTRFDGRWLICSPGVGG